jgi:hypothetical protein
MRTSDHAKHRGDDRRQMRLFHTFVTTAPVVLDAPSTVTLYLAR